MIYVIWPRPFASALLGQNSVGLSEDRQQKALESYEQLSEAWTSQDVRRDLVLEFSTHGDPSTLLRVTLSITPLPRDLISLYSIACISASHIDHAQIASSGRDVCRF